MNFDFVQSTVDNPKRYKPRFDLVGNDSDQFEVNMLLTFIYYKFQIMNYPSVLSKRQTEYQLW